MDIDQQKLAAAEKALELVDNGMKLGLGTGSTAAKFIELLGARVKDGLRVVGIPTSHDTAQLAQEAGVPLSNLNEHPHLDLTVDGADEIDSELRLIKGGGGALLREKIVAMASAQMVVIADKSKLVQTLGLFPLPVEVEGYGLRATELMIEALAQEVGCDGEIKLRVTKEGQPFKTDGGHLILDCSFGVIPEPEALSEALTMVPGVIETGLFLAIADVAVIAGPDEVIVLEASDY